MTSLGTLGASRTRGGGWRDDVDRMKVQLWTAEMLSKGRDVYASLERQAEAECMRPRNVFAEYNKLQLGPISRTIGGCFAGIEEQFATNTTVGEANA